MQSRTAQLKGAAAVTQSAEASNLNALNPRAPSAAQVNEAAEVIYDLVDAQANLIFGAVVDPAMKNGEVT